MLKKENALLYGRERERLGVGQRVPKWCICRLSADCKPQSCSDSTFIWLLDPVSDPYSEYRFGSGSRCWGLEVTQGNLSKVYFFHSFWFFLVKRTLTLLQLQTKIRQISTTNQIFLVAKCGTLSRRIRIRIQNLLEVLDFRSGSDPYIKNTEPQPWILHKPATMLKSSRQKWR